MVIDRTLSSDSPPDYVAQKLQEMQTWLTSTSRDILDENDEILHVRYQLIYTIGQQALDDGQDRWTTQNILDHVRRHTRKFHEELLEEVELFEYITIGAFEGKFLMYCTLTLGF